MSVNVLKKFATVRRRPSEAAALSSTNRIKSLRTSRSMTRNHRSGLSFAIRQSSCFADAAFDYALYCRTRACMLCMFVLPPISLIKVVNSDSFRSALSVFIYFRFMLVFRVKFAGDVNQKISFETTALSNTFARSLLGLIHWSPSCPLQLSIFSI